MDMSLPLLADAAAPGEATTPAIDPVVTDPSEADDTAVRAAAELALADRTRLDEMAAAARLDDEVGADSRPAEEIYQRVGLLTRTLHNALRELGYDKQLSDARGNLPDARDRLTYIARVTGEAAEKVLNGVDQARGVQEGLAKRALELRTRWLAVGAYAGKGGRATPAGQALVEETCAFFEGVGGQADATNAILTDIMMAQDFHDLTGQVIRKVVALATTLEEQLLKLLLEASPPESRKKLEETLEGPVVNYEGRADVVSDQAGVDDLLASLGF